MTLWTARGGNGFSHAPSSFGIVVLGSRQEVHRHSLMRRCWFRIDPCLTTWLPVDENVSNAQRSPTAVQCRNHELTVASVCAGIADGVDFLWRCAKRDETLPSVERR